MQDRQHRNPREQPNVGVAFLGGGCCLGSGPGWLTCEPPSHKAVVEAERATNRVILSNALAKGKKVAAETPEQRIGRMAAEANARAITHALYVAEGVSPHAVGTMMSSTSPLRLGVSKLERAGVCLGAETTVRDDLAKAERLLNEELRMRVTSLKGSVITDGASFRSGHCVAILFGSAGLAQPILLQLVHPDDDGTYDHTKAGVDVRESLAAFGIDLSTQVCSVLSLRVVVGGIVNSATESGPGRLYHG
jgi:hypothetical protein